MNSLSILKFPSAEPASLASLAFGISALALLIVLGYLLLKYFKAKKAEKRFFEEASYRGLTGKEAGILWDYSLALGRDPFLSLEFKAPFEKVVDLYLSKAAAVNDPLVQEMRVKLGFDYVPYFVSLVTTKDLDLLQSARLYLPRGEALELVLTDKDERYMYWSVVGSSVPKGLVGSRATVSFVRKGDGIYKFEGLIEEVQEGEQPVIKMPHTFRLTRYQRREYARIAVEVPVEVGLERDGSVVWLKGEVVDVSAGGAKVCLPQELPELSPGTTVLLKFKLLDRDFSLKATVVNVYPRKHAVCYGVKFEDLRLEERKFLNDFVKSGGGKALTLV